MSVAPRRSLLRSAIVHTEYVFYRVSTYLRSSWRSDEPAREMVPEIYRAFAIGEKVDVMGRVLSARTLPEPNEHDDAWTNALRMLRRWMTGECPYTAIFIQVGSTAVEAVTDSEGYFEVEMDLPQGVTEIQAWLPSKIAGQEPSRVISEYIIQNDSDPQYVIVSDVDDTIFISNTAKIWGMIKTALTGNALTRQIFSGVPSFYQELRKGPAGASQNPVAYVTSSPWNLHSFLARIFSHREIPSGAYFMTDWGITHDNWLKEPNPVHKRRAILKILRWFPQAPVVLLGDSSQHDAEIYVGLAEEFPERIAAITIRNVTGLDESPVPVPSGVPFLLHTETSEARAFILEKLTSSRSNLLK